MPNLPIIGRHERVHLPELGFSFIEAKIDSGAYTSAIHCFDIQRIQSSDKLRLRFLDPSHRLFKETYIEHDIHDQRAIKNSFGNEEERFIIKTPIILMGQTYDIELSLSDRSNLEYPLLLGRKALYHRFLVDVSLRNVWYKSQKKSTSTNKPS